MQPLGHLGHSRGQRLEQGSPACLSLPTPRENRTLGVARTLAPQHHHSPALCRTDSGSMNGPHSQGALAWCHSLLRTRFLCSLPDSAPCKEVPPGRVGAAPLTPDGIPSSLRWAAHHSDSQSQPTFQAPPSPIMSTLAPCKQPQAWVLSNGLLSSGSTQPTVPAPPCAQRHGASERVSGGSMPLQTGRAPEGLVSAEHPQSASQATILGTH